MADKPSWQQPKRRCWRFAGIYRPTLLSTYKRLQQAANHRPHH